MQKGVMMNRRALLKTAATIPLAAATASLSPTNGHAARLGFVPSWRESRVKLSCNLYSFNAPLRDKRMTLDGVLEFCAELGFDAVDPTAYYFPNYPELPDDSYVYQFKRTAFRLGLDISGTGTRNDFTLADQRQRRSEVEGVKRWVGFAARLGAPVLRSFRVRVCRKAHDGRVTEGG